MKTVHLMERSPITINSFFKNAPSSFEENYISLYIDRTIKLVPELRRKLSFYLIFTKTPNPESFDLTKNQENITIEGEQVSTPSGKTLRKLYEAGFHYCHAEIEYWTYE